MQKNKSTIKTKWFFNQSTPLVFITITQGAKKALSIFILKTKPSNPLVLIIILILQTGCQMNHPIIQEMDSAYAKNESNDDVTKVVQKYFLVGTEFKKALPLLNQLKDDDFEIREHRHGVGRFWPNGKFSAPSDELVKNNREKRYPKGTKGFVIQKRYEVQMLIVIKTASIYIKVDTHGRLSEVTGHIYISAI